MGLGPRVAGLRKRSGESLQQLASAVDVSKAHIWELEKGNARNPSMGLVQRLADHFGVSVSYLVGEDLEADDDMELARMFRQARELNDRERGILDQMLQSLRETRLPANASESG